MKRYHIEHNTTYHYASPAGVSAHIAHLHPRVSELQSCEAFSLSITPQPSDLSQTQDYFGNLTHFFSLQQLHEALSVRAVSEVSVTAQYVPNPGETASCKQTRQYLQHLSPRATGLVEEYTYPSSLVPWLKSAHSYGAAILHEDRPVLEAVIDLAQAIYSEFEFNPKATELSTPVAEVFKLKGGVCQDFAHLMLACLRAHQIPALYVSGYILTHPPPGKERMIGADASHAWISVYVPETGWIDIDPTNNLVVADEHITVARGRDYEDVSPIRGEVVGGGAHEMEVEVTVMPAEEWQRRSAEKTEAKTPVT